MSKDNHSLFFTPENDSKDFNNVLRDVQEYISSKYSTLLIEDDKAELSEQVKRYIGKYLIDYRIAVKGMTTEQLIDALYSEMVEFSFLTKYIYGTGVEEINVNSWRDIEVQYSNGNYVKLEEHFESPEHAINVMQTSRKKECLRRSSLENNHQQDTRHCARGSHSHPGVADRACLSRHRQPGAGYIIWHGSCLLEKARPV